MRHDVHPARTLHPVGAVALESWPRRPREGLAEAGLEEITLHPTDELPEAFRLMLFGGLALGAVGIAAAVWRAYRAVAREC